MTVLATRAIPDGSFEPLRAAGLAFRMWEPDEPMQRPVLLDAVREIKGLMCTITERIDEELLAAAPHLAVVANFGVGYDNVDVGACTQRDVVVCNTPGVLTGTTADMAFALLLGVARRLGEGGDTITQGAWKYWSPTLLVGHDVHHATLGIVGMGAIGWQVAKRALGFDMRVLYTSRTPRPELEARAPIERVELDTLLRESDFVSLHVPLTPATRHVIGAPQLQLMKRTAFVINTARGALVDQQALYAACASRAIAGAGLDVTDPEPLPKDDPLLHLPNVLVMPHVASATAETRLKMGELSARNVAAVLTGQRPPAAVNPEVLERLGVR